MLPVVVRTTPSLPAGEVIPSAAAVEGMIRAVAVPQDCLEHLTVTRGDEDLSSAVFIRARDLAHAEQQVDRLMQRKLGQALPLAGRTVTECIAADLRRPTQ
ncbi:hypothetical protein [Streptacidiphilus albus]|uniref:hypothetical protein n=1 Tax=Streptacidiphilus albus TaxID=105425 RepID=UPI00054C6228|nr:hypothetical protein [Streptacidiphilus albus]